MAKTAAQKAAKRARKAAKKLLACPPKTIKKAPGKKRNKPSPSAAGGALATSSRVMSSVNDGANVGMVWKNSGHVRDFFAPRFEKVADIVTNTTAFDIIQAYYLNPGNSVLFPVFSAIAANYEQYICHRLRFWYRGESYMAVSGTTSAGILIYATNFDPDDPDFDSVESMENYEGCVSGPPFAGHFMHDALDSRRKRKPQQPLNEYFVYPSANQSASSDSTAKFYDLGLFQMASNGTQNISPAGELWVEHSWTMLRRRQTPLQQTTVLFAHISEGPAASAAVAGSAFLGTTGGLVTGASTLPVSTTKSTFTLPYAGTFLVFVSFISPGQTLATVSLALGGNLSQPTVFEDGAVGLVKSNSTAYCTYGTIIVVSASGTGASNTVTISGLTNLVAGYADIVIAQVANGFTLPRRKITAGVKAIDERLARLEEILRAQPNVLNLIEGPDGVLVRSEQKSFSKDESDSAVNPKGNPVRGFWK